VELGAQGVMYCDVDSRALLTNEPNNWIITDDGESDDCTPPLTINDFLILEGSGSDFHKTELLQKAIGQLNEQLDNSSQVTLMDFLKGEVVNGEIFMEFDLQAIVDAMNGDDAGIDEIEIEEEVVVY
jgi:hypothetical protein